MRALCRFSPGGPVRRVSESARRVAPRLGGGAFVLEHDGTLRRFDRMGRPSGEVATDLDDLAVAGTYVCAALAGEIGCFRDRHEDWTCRTSPFEAHFQPLPLEVAGRLDGDPTRSFLRARARKYRDVFWEVVGTCDQHCVVLGCDGPARCLDACAPHQPAVLSVRPAPPDWAPLGPATASR